MHRADVDIKARPEWTGRRERGSEFAMRLMARLTYLLGRGAGRCLIYPIALYFAVFSVGARRASRAYLARVLGRRASFADVLRHYHTFGCTLHDRLYLASGRIGELDIALHQSDDARKWLEDERGCILLGSHLGSFEVLRAFAATRQARPLNVLMHVDTEAKTARVFRSMSREPVDPRVIPLGQPQSLLRVQECLERGEMVGILADRVWRNDRSLDVDFLGASARLPVGPWSLAALLNAPVVLFFGLYRGGRRYEIHLEAFAPAITLDRRNEAAGARPWIERYARRLEAHCRLAPYNWFNFYDYWH